MVFLSGDRHFAELSRRQEPGLYPLYEITSSGLNRRFPEDYVNPNRFRLTGADPDAAASAGATPGAYLLENFGELEVDWDQADPVLRFRIVDASGATRLALDIPLSELNF